MTKSTIFSSGAKEDLIGLIEQEVEGASGRGANQSWAFDSLLTHRATRKLSKARTVGSSAEHRRPPTPHPTPRRRSTPVRDRTTPLSPNTPLSGVHTEISTQASQTTHTIHPTPPPPLPARDLHSCHPLSPRRRWWRIRGGRAEGGISRNISDPFIKVKLSRGEELSKKNWIIIPHGFRALPLPSPVSGPGRRYNYIPFKKMWPLGRHSARRSMLNPVADQPAVTSDSVFSN